MMYTTSRTPRCMTSSDTILTLLRKKGCRIGKGLRHIVDVLVQAKKPLAPLEVHAALQKRKATVNQVTVYRQLRSLTAAGVVHRVNLRDDVQRYELATHGAHTHHLVCTSCKDVTNIDMECAYLHRIERHIGKGKKFQIRGHSLEFYGTCSRCA